MTGRAGGGSEPLCAERADLLGLSDDELFRRMAQERRAIMTDNVKDLVPLTSHAAVAADDHDGLLFTSGSSMPRPSDTIGRFVDALDGFLRRYEGEESYRNQVQWLSVSSPHQGR